MKKNIVKMVLTTALVATAIIGSNKLEAKAMTIEEFSQFTGVPVENIMTDPELMEIYGELADDDASLWMASATAPVDSTVVAVPTVAGIGVSHPEMLALVNADRTANGAGNLAWNADLEAYCISRLPVALANYQSPEYAAAKSRNDGSKSEIAHRGYTERENLAWTGGSFGTDTAERHNTRWIESTGHHKERTKVGFTQYACASYVDPVTGDEVWIEAFK